MDASEQRRRVESARVARLATVDPDGNPHLVPVCFALRGDVVYTAIDEKPKRDAHPRRLANLEATGRACLLVDEYREDWSRLWWVRLDGRGRVVDDGTAEAADARAGLTARYPQYAQRPPRGPVVAIEVSRWSGWSISGGGGQPPG
ncbi:PPOX class probable F420-dependent enzyme, Rv0121 family [Micromonospora pattaloongensis]|uniref:PPOX class probable F420-dependent enzyme, Rv0121 family n=1 Tax=Micromonospora pattaloongensis TaxID=405436 RepID=A0A1H3LW95_9ACTN|nr:TIGR03668 family PPOX class F420-dependent oxidoreductase [Micromonospora pattaloongensis]SDY68797.1 PPOX class probable F420-dependent enzyme, Rv0121 family [Micromonospora pattaloongensis]